MHDNIQGYVTTNTRYITLVEDSIENVQSLKSRDSELCVLMVRSLLTQIMPKLMLRCNSAYLNPPPFNYYVPFGFSTFIFVRSRTSIACIRKVYSIRSHRSIPPKYPRSDLT